MPIAVGVLISLAYWPGTLGAAVNPRWWAVAIGGLLLAKRPSRVAWQVLVAIGALLAWSSAGLIWTPDWMGAVHEEIHLAVLVLALLVGSSLEPDVFDRLLCGLAWGVVVQGPLVVAQLLGFDWPLELSSPPAGLFANRDILGEAAGLLLVWAVSRRGSVPLVMSLSAVLVMSQSRVGLGAAAGALILAGRGPVRIGLLLAAGLLLVWWLDPGKTESVNLRLQIWQYTAEGLSLRGFGLGSFNALHPYWEYAHSDGLQAAYEWGIPAAALLVVAGALLAIRRPGPLLWASLVEGAISFSLHMPLTGFISAMVVGYSLGPNGSCAAVDSGRSSRRVPVELGGGWEDEDSQRSSAGGEGILGLVRD